MNFRIVVPERIQKFLALAGLGSRRDIERWIAAGRVLVNGAAPLPGAKVDHRDRITLDGRTVRFKTDASAAAELVLLHRSPGTPLDIESVMRHAREHGIKSRSRRWVPVLPLPPVDGGLELLCADGALAQRIARRAFMIDIEFMMRARGPLDEALVAELLTAREIESGRLHIVAASLRTGGASNHWLQCIARDTRPALLRHWLAARGVMVGRLMRIGLGPLKLGRELPRGRVRVVSASERSQLLRSLASEPDEEQPSAARRARRPTARRKTGR